MRLGIVGCGLIGQKRAAAATAHQIALVCDTKIERARMLAVSAGAEAVQDWRKVVEADIDAVIVSTTHDNLSEIALAAVDANKHVLVEKPAARALDEASLVREAARRRGVLVKVGYNHRFHPGFVQAWELASSGTLGPLYY